MAMNNSLTAAIATALLASSALAQTNFPEIEPNSQKAEATPVTGIVANDTVTGVSTGTTTTLGLTTDVSVDVYRVKTGALTAGIYKHTLTLTSTTAGQSGIIRGQGQTAGVPNGTDTGVQFSTGAANTWYGFGSQEELYYQVNGTSTTTAAYTATLATAPITPVVVPGLYNPGTITVRTDGQGHTTDTEIYLYDSAYNPVPLGHNDDILGAGVGRSKVIVTLTAGTYYIAVANYNTANNLGDANPGENFLLGALLDFPNVLVNTSNTAAVNVAFSVSDGTTTTPVAATRAAQFEIVWATFTVQVNTNPPPNDLCANATPIGNGAFGGIIQFATNDGLATCDTGGTGSRDVWFSYTNTSPGALQLTADTCGSSFDTVLSVYDACGGNELACSDNCGGVPCGATSSCVSLNINAAQVVKIRVSDKGLGGGVYVLNVKGAPLNDDCNTPIVLTGPGVYAFDDTLATTGTQGQGATAGCGSGPDNDLWYTYAANTNGTITVSTSGQITSTDTDTLILIYSGAGCPVGAGIACDDDSGIGVTSIVTFPSVCGTTYTIQLGNFFSGDAIFGTFTVTETGTACATPTVSYCSGDGTDTACPCANPGLPGRGCNNTVSSGGAGLTSSGIASISADTLVLSGNNAVPFGPGLYYQGSTPALAGPPFGVTFGHGLRCAGGATPRLEIRGADGTGASSTTVPIHILGSTAAGDVRYYQLWYRDSPLFGTCTIGFNLSSALMLTWAP